MGQKGRVIMRKLTHEYVSECFSKAGCKLIDQYKNTRTLVSYCCSCGTIAKINVNVFINRGGRCKNCGIEKTKTAKKLDFNYVKKNFFEHGCELLDDDYLGNNKPLNYKCSCGVISKITFGNFQSGQRCKGCGNQKISNKQTGDRNHRWVADRDKVYLRSVIHRKCKQMLSNTLNKLKETKLGKTADILGYTRQDLLDRIINHQNWSSVKDKNWHLDHIFPVKAFTDHDIYDLKRINALTNLQPLSARDNLIKGSNYNEHDFKEYLCQN